MAFMDEVEKKEVKGNGTGLRIVAVLFWVLAIAFQFGTVLGFAGKLGACIPIPNVVIGILALVLDLAFLLIGSKLWKSANLKSPVADEKSVKYWCRNNLGVVIASVAFFPFVLIAAGSKNADKKTRLLAVLGAIVVIAADVLLILL